MFAEGPGNHLEVLEALHQIGVPNLRKRNEELQTQGPCPRGTSWVSRHMYFKQKSVEAGDLGGSPASSFSYPVGLLLSP